MGTSTAPPPTTPTTTLTPAQIAKIADLVTQANAHYAAAYTDLKNADFAGFASEMKIVGDLLQQLQQITGTAPAQAGRASPSPGHTTPTSSRSPQRGKKHRERGSPSHDLTATLIYDP